MFEGENFCGFCRFLLTTNVLPLKIFLLRNQNTKIGSHWQTAEVFPTIMNNTVDKPRNFSPLNVLSYQYIEVHNFNQHNHTPVHLKL